MTLSPEVAAAHLLTTSAIRERCENILTAGLHDKLKYFKVNIDGLSEVATKVVEVTRKNYPKLEIPYHSRWNHFRVGGHDRLKGLELSGRDQFALVIQSVLLDAGAGPDWHYKDAQVGGDYSRSEGLAVASLRMFEAGQLAGDSASLKAFSAEILAKGFQVSDQNPLRGLEGRAGLVRDLGKAVEDNPEIFKAGSLGGMFDYLVAAAVNKKLPATSILTAVLDGLGPIWPDRISLAGINLGDVWQHPFAGGAGSGAGLVPFHKLSQWLSYSLVEPLEWSGITVTGLDDLTGLAEYRNGGLFFDIGTIALKEPDLVKQAHKPSSELVIEWRALTVALLDRLAPLVREKLGLSASELPLAKILEGGTWATGRELAYERRPNGAPPIQLISDGTVF